VIGGENPAASAWPWLVNVRRADGVLLTGVYGSGQGSVAEEITYLLEQRGEPYALLVSTIWSSATAVHRGRRRMG
jgi:hypothetical protein